MVWLLTLPSAPYLKADQFSGWDMVQSVISMCELHTVYLSTSIIVFTLVKENTVNLFTAKILQLEML